MGPAFAGLHAAPAPPGIAAAGSTFARHFRGDPDGFDSEDGIPAGGVASAAGGPGPSEPAAGLARGRGMA